MEWGSRLKKFMVAPLDQPRRNPLYPGGRSGFRARGRQIDLMEKEAGRFFHGMKKLLGLRSTKRLNLPFKPLNRLLVLGNVPSELKPSEEVGNDSDQQAQERGEESGHKKRQGWGDPFLMQKRRKTEPKDDRFMISLGEEDDEENGSHPQERFEAPHVLSSPFRLFSPVA